MTGYIELERKFWPIETTEENSSEHVPIMLALGVDRRLSWTDLLKKSRVVILAEAGTGKTEELRAMTRRLRSNGTVAFFCRIEILQSFDIRDAFDPGLGTSREFDAWLRGEHEGYFFLDSVDEARLQSQAAFDIALRRFSGALGDPVNLNRAKVVISCRVSNWRATTDLDLFSAHLPITTSVELQENRESAVKTANRATANATMLVSADGSEGKKEPIVFQLAPLDEQQIRRFAIGKGIENPNDFMQAVSRADAGIFAERPQDLLDLIAFWKVNQRLGGHAEMLAFSVQHKLEEPNPDRDTRRPLPPDDALWGLERLAAALTFQKRNTIILPDRPIDPDLQSVSIDAKASLPEWSSDTIQTLLDRAIFDEAMYGTVRFHHRSVREYLTAKWLLRLLTQGKSRRSIEALVFANRYGREVVIPSMRPIAAWLALWDDHVRHRLHSIAPEVLIEHGDPSALPVEVKRTLLVRFAECYAEHPHTTGISLDVTMCRRLADPQLAPIIRDLLRRFAAHTDVCTLLLKIIWQGRIAEAVDAALPCAIEARASVYTRTCALRAVAAAGTQEQRTHLVNTLLRDPSTLDSILLSELCEAFFPESLSVERLLEIIESASPPTYYSRSDLQQSLETIVDTLAPDPLAEQLLRGLHSLTKHSLLIADGHCALSERYAWVVPSALKLANLFIRERLALSFDPIVLNLFLGFFALQSYGSIVPSTREELLTSAQAWPEFGFQLFWHAVDDARSRVGERDRPLNAWWQVRGEMRDFWLPSAIDLDRLFDCLTNKPLMDDRLIALTALFTVYLREKRPRRLRGRMTRAVAGTPELETTLHTLFHPRPVSTEEKKHSRWMRDEKQRQKLREQRESVMRKDWQKALKDKPEEVRNVGNAREGQIWRRTTYLYDRIREKHPKNKNRLGYSDWKCLHEEFGEAVATNFRDGCLSFWRGYDPFSFPNRRTDNAIPLARMIGLSGLAMEAADNPAWVNTLTSPEAQIAAYYAVCEISGFPSWVAELRRQFPDLVDRVIEEELRWELHESPKEHVHPHVLSALQYSEEDFPQHYKGAVADFLSVREPINDHVMMSALALILKGPLDTALRDKIDDLAYRRFRSGDYPHRRVIWLSVLFCVNGQRGYSVLTEWITSLSSEAEQKASMIEFCATLANSKDSHFGYAIHDYEKIEVLKQLVPLIYRFVPVEDDIRHQGAYTPGTRDNAQHTRSRLVDILFDTPGRASYDALLHVSQTIDAGSVRDRMDYLAKERAALDAECEPWAGSEVATFAEYAEREPRTEAELHQLALARLDDLKIDIEDGDESEAALLQRLSEETEVRTVFANRLRKASRSRYTVSSEEELADATRTDIRLHAPQVVAPVPIELKIADKWTATELRERLENQLIKQYMRVSRYGIFLVVYRGDKQHWKEPPTNRRVTFVELVTTLKHEVTTLIKRYSSVADLEIVGIDFTARSRKASK